MGDQTDTTQPTTPTEDKSKAEAPKSRSHRRGDGRQAQTAQQQPTKEKEEVVDKAALLRGMTTIALNPKASIDNNPGGTLNMYVLRQASEAVKKLELTPILGKDPPVLEIELKTNTSGDSTSLEISAELKCATEKQKAVTVWQDKKTILTGKTGKIRLTQNPGLMTNLRPPIKEFRAVCCGRS